MLHAVVGRKTRLHHRYISRDPAVREKVQSEDELTSIIFGPAAFMRAEDSILLWRELLDAGRDVSFLPSGQPSSVEWLFWPRQRRKSRGVSQSVEPDMLVRYTWNDVGARSILVEVKWNAPLSEGQLQRQWTQCVPKDERSSTIHLYLAKGVAGGVAAVQGDNVWGRSEPSRLRFISWLQLRTTLAHAATNSVSLKPWAVEGEKFLQAIGVQQFAGFQSILARLGSVPRSGVPATAEGSREYPWRELCTAIPNIRE